MHIRMMHKGKRKSATVYLAAAVILTCYLAQTIDCYRLKITERREERKVAEAAKTIGVQEGEIVFGRVFERGSGLVSEVVDGTKKSSSNASVEDEAAYQADFAGWSKGQTQDASSKEASWRRMAPSLQCSADQMKFRAVGPGSSQFAVEQGNAPPMPLSQVPSSCGYNMQRNPLGLVMLVPFDGCNMVQEGGSHVLPMRWQGTPVSLWCPQAAAAPAPTAAAPHHPVPQTPRYQPPYPQVPQVPQVFQAPQVPQAFQVPRTSKNPQVSNHQQYFYPPYQPYHKYPPVPEPTTATTTKKKEMPQHQQYPFFNPFYPYIPPTTTAKPTTAAPAPTFPPYNPFFPPFPWPLPVTAKPTTTTTKPKPQLPQFPPYMFPPYNFLYPPFLPPVPPPTTTTTTTTKPKPQPSLPPFPPYMMFPPYNLLYPPVFPPYPPPTTKPTTTTTTTTTTKKADPPATHFHPHIHLPYHFPMHFPSSG